MKKILVVLCLAFLALSLVGCKKEDTIIVYTESGFEPFEYVKDGKIVGVDVDIMELVGKKLNKKVVFENVDFNIIIDTVKEGKLANVGAAGISITDERKEKVDFSNVYYTANLYVIYNINKGVNSKTMTDGNTGVYWSSLTTTLGIGVQGGTTADFFLDDELATGGSLEGTNKTSYSKLSVACAAIGKDIDYVIIDELPAKELVKGNSSLACLPLYYEGSENEDDVLAYDEYAICVTKGDKELLNAINEVLNELKAQNNNGVNGIEALINKHLGI